MSWTQDTGTGDRKSLLAFGLFTFLCMAGVFALFSQTRPGLATNEPRASFADPGGGSEQRIGRAISAAIERAAAPSTQESDGTTDEDRADDKTGEKVLRLR